MTIKKLYDEYNVPPRIKEPKRQNSENATLDDILDSLLGLSSSSRTPSPARTSLDSEMVGSPIGIADNPHRSYGDTNNSIL